MAMFSIRWQWLLILAWLCCPWGVYGQTPSEAWQDIPAGERLFALQVAPALESKCVTCHGAEATELESGLSLLTREDLLRGGDSGEPVLVPEDHQQSWLYLSATWEHDVLQMPPKENDRLDAATLEALAKWIDLGAPWPSAERVAQIRTLLDQGVTVSTSGGLASRWDERRYRPDSLWAYQPLTSADRLLPAGGEGSYQAAANPIDGFLNARLAELSIAPAPRADRRTLVRRLYFDLLGLPPDPSDVSDFVNDPAPDEIAWERLVDRLLASPQFGEQWARHWLDTVRYADSAGFANDYQRPNAWRYRDYVVRCLNQDRSLDQFIREQIAGDELDPHDPEMLIAVGMLRMGPWEHTGMSVAKITRQQFLDDVTDVVGQAFLAHPLQCARCHDHKFDPIPTRDYYRIQAVFATTQFADRDAAFLESENQNIFAEQQAYLEQRIRYYEQLLNELDAKELRAAKAWYAERDLPYASRAEKLKQGVPEDQIAPRRVGFGSEDFGRERIARKYLERHRWELDAYRPIAFSVGSGPAPKQHSVHSRISWSASQAAGQGAATHILTGGDPFSPGAPVSPGVLSVLLGVRQPEPAAVMQQASAVTEQTSGRRTEFAAWLTDPQRNPLTPRVMVNRIWQHHFGRGLVDTPNNFGTAGAQPTHPAMLDYLAQQLLESAWSAKQIHRLIVTSDAYCRAGTYTGSESSALQARLSELDPNHQTYAVFMARRQAAEELRDSILSICGLLNRELGGAPIRPDMNAEVAAQPRQIMGTYAPVYQPSPHPADRNRRTLYALRLRGLRDPMLEVFNQPSPDLPCEMRDSSTVAPQALTLFNSPLSRNRALAMAQRLSSEATQHDWDDAQVLQRAFQLTYSRAAAPEELAACLQHWRSMELRHAPQIWHEELPPPEITREFVDENTGEQFSYTEPLEQNRDYLPDIRPATTSPKTRGLAEVCLVLLSSNELLYVP